jgi:hypothetical protein
MRIDEWFVGRAAELSLLARRMDAARHRRPAAARGTSRDR